jgi:hypothetical protein
MWDLKVEKKGGGAEVQTSKEDAFVVQNQIFLEAVRLGKPSLIRSGYRDAMNTLAVTLAANESARTGSSVRVQLPQ